MDEYVAIDLKKLFDSQDCKLPDATEYGYWKARLNRMFYIDYEIDDAFMAVELAKTILQMNFDEKDIPKKELKPIYIFVFSYGGYSDQADCLRDVIKTSRIPIYTVGMGACMSNGFMLLIAGHKRYVFKNTQLMIHSGSNAIGGTAQQVEEASKNYKFRLEKENQYILENTKIDPKVFKKNKDKDWYLTPEEIEQYEIATVIEKIEDIM